MSSSRYQVTDAVVEMPGVLSASTSSFSSSLSFAQETKSSRKKNKPSPAHQRQLLRVLAVAFGFALFSIQRSTRIDSAADELSSLYGDVQEYAHWMLSAAGGGSGTLPEPDLHYVHESYYFNDGYISTATNTAPMNTCKRCNRWNFCSTRDSAPHASTEAVVFGYNLVDGHENKKRIAKRTQSLNTNANTNTTGERTMYYIDGLGGCRHMLLPPAQEENDQDQPHSSNSTIIIYNPHDNQPRLFCGETIGPGMTLQIVVEEIQRTNPAMIKCLQRNVPSRLHEHIPGPHNAMEFPPVRIRNRQGSGNANL